MCNRLLAHISYTYVVVMKKIQQHQQNIQLNKIYYNPSDPAAFSSASKLTIAALTSNDKINTQKWLSSQLAYSIHRPNRKMFPTRKYFTSGINDLWKMNWNGAADATETNDQERTMTTATSVDRCCGRPFFCSR